MWPLRILLHQHLPLVCMDTASLPSFKCYGDGAADFCLGVCILDELAELLGSPKKALNRILCPPYIYLHPRHTANEYGNGMCYPQRSLYVHPLATYTCQLRITHLACGKVGSNPQKLMPQLILLLEVLQDYFCVFSICLGLVLITWNCLLQNWILGSSTLTGGSLGFQTGLSQLSLTLLPWVVCMQCRYSYHCATAPSPVHSHL